MARDFVLVVRFLSVGKCTGVVYSAGLGSAEGLGKVIKRVLRVFIVTWSEFNGLMFIRGNRRFVLHLSR